MKEKWVISDTHFNHANIVKWDSGRKHDFDDVNHMNETIIQNWNRVVKPGDKVYHLGDVFFGSKDDFKKLWPRLNGRKTLIAGNHDDIKFLSSGGFFSNVRVWRMFPEFKTVLTHVPITLSQEERRKYDYNVHGHLHKNYVTYNNGNKDTRYYNACVEVNNYTPLHLETLCEKIRMGYG